MNNTADDIVEKSRSPANEKLHRKVSEPAAGYNKSTW